jgi:hypothetical protein
VALVFVRKPHGCGGLGCGLVYELQNSVGSWTETVLYQFAGGSDGVFPDGGGILDTSGRRLEFKRRRFGRVMKSVVTSGSIPKKGAAAFLLDVMVAEGKFIRIWSQEKNDYVYRISDISEASRFAV